MVAPFGHELAKDYKEPIAHFLLQVVVIIVFCRVIGRLLTYLKQPIVIGEIIAGIILGPSVLAQSYGWNEFVFPASSLTVLKVVAEVGVVFFMFFMGLEVRPSEIRQAFKSSMPIALAGVILPFGIGCSLSFYIHDLVDSTTDKISFMLFVGASMSFTAFPVLARILAANNAITSRIGVRAMSIASVDDLLAWTVLAIATSYHSGVGALEGLYTILTAIAWVLFLALVVRPLLEQLHLYLRKKKRETSTDFVVVVFLGMCCSAWMTQMIGVHSFFGAFVFGIIVPKDGVLVDQYLMPKIELLILNFFVPLYFANSGLRTDLRTLGGNSKISGAIIVVILCATIGKILPALVMGILFNYGKKFSLQLAILINTRGLIELIALNIALTVGAFNVQVFSMFVIMALVTTFVSGPLFWYLYDPKEDPPRTRPAALLLMSDEVLVANNKQEEHTIEMPTVRGFNNGVNQSSDIDHPENVQNGHVDGRSKTPDDEHDHSEEIKDRPVEVHVVTNRESDSPVGRAPVGVDPAW